MYSSEKQRDKEMKSLEPKVAKFELIQEIYRSGKEPKGKTWVQVCKEYESLLASYIRYDYLKQCTYKINQNN